MPERVRHDEEPITFALHIKTEYTVWMANEHVDVIIVGAGLLGIGAARHLQTECPDRSYRVLESRSASGGRSEEHTSELQSLMRISYAVFCLKKKKTSK